MLFVGVVCREGAAALPFGLAGLPRGGHRLRHAAFAAGPGLWAASLLADEVFVAYALGPFPAPFQLMVLRSLVGAGLYPRPPPDCMPLPCRCVVPDAFSRDGLTLDRAATMPLPP